MNLPPAVALPTEEAPLVFTGLRFRTDGRFSLFVLGGLVIIFPVFFILYKSNTPAAAVALMLVYLIAVVWAGRRYTPHYTLRLYPDRLEMLLEKGVLGKHRTVRFETLRKIARNDAYRLMETLFFYMRGSIWPVRIIREMIFTQGKPFAPVNTALAATLQAWNDSLPADNAQRIKIDGF